MKKLIAGLIIGAALGVGGFTAASGGPHGPRIYLEPAGPGMWAGCDADGDLYAANANEASTVDGGPRLAIYWKEGECS